MDSADHIDLDEIEPRESSGQGLDEYEMGVRADHADPADHDQHGAKLAALQPSDEELVLAYRIGARVRAAETNMVRIASRGEVKFSIWGPGEEVHGVATALALSKVVGPDRIGMVLHYRSGALFAMWCHLNGYDSYTEAVLRQQYSRATDAMSAGRQMVNHFGIRELGVLPVQSPVGMQLGKAAGYAMGYRFRGIDDGIALAILGDGTTAEGDLHEAMNAASVWDLPLIVMVTDNEIAISTKPAQGRGIKDFAAYAAGFEVRFFECDGRDFQEVYDTTLEMALFVRDAQRPAFLWVHDLPRFSGHSSAADVTFDLTQEDPLIGFGEMLVERGLLEPEDVLRRVDGEGRDFFQHHELGRLMASEDREIHEIIRTVRAEPEPDPAGLHEHIYPPFPEVQECDEGGQTVITYAGAVRAAIDNIVALHGGVLWGQDVGELGGVMQATAGLKERYPDRIIDAPLNEPLILGTACGAGLHDDIVVMSEIQFSDYSLNAFHWLVHMGNLHWTTVGQSKFSVIARMPVDPFGGGALYHSMSVDGFFTPIPGLVICMPSTSRDAYGLMMTAAEYRGSVVMLEPKWMYRQALGPAFPGEPTDPNEVLELRRDVLHGEIPEIDSSVRVPFSRAAVRRRGGDLTVVAWGRATWTSLDAAKLLAQDGIEAEVIDLRTLVPPDLDTVYESVARTGRLVVAAEDRAFAGFVRTIQGHVVERFPGTPTRALGQKNIPGVAQSHMLEDATVLCAGDVVRAGREVMETKVGSASGWIWMPRRYTIG